MITEKKLPQRSFFFYALYKTQIAEQAVSVCVRSGSLSCGDTFHEQMLSEQRIRKKKSQQGFFFLRCERSLAKGPEGTTYTPPKLCNNT